MSQPPDGKPPHEPRKGGIVSRLESQTLASIAAIFEEGRDSNVVPQPLQPVDTAPRLEIGDVAEAHDDDDGDDDNVSSPTTPRASQLRLDIRDQDTEQEGEVGVVVVEALVTPTRDSDASTTGAQASAKRKRVKETTKGTKGKGTEGSGRVASREGSSGLYSSLDLGVLVELGAQAQHGGVLPGRGVASHVGEGLGEGVGGPGVGGVVPVGAGEGTMDVSVDSEVTDVRGVQVDNRIAEGGSFGIGDDSENPIHITMADDSLQTGPAGEGEPEDGGGGGNITDTSPPTLTFNQTVQGITEFIEVAIHTILYVRQVYPEELFVRRKKYETPVYQSRHPALNEYISGAVKAVGEEIALGNVEKVVVVIKDKAQVPLERFIFSIEQSVPVEGFNKDTNVVGGLTPAVLGLYFRSFLIKLNMIESQLGVLNSGDDVSFAIILELKDGVNPSAAPTSKDSPPWMPADNTHTTAGTSDEAELHMMRAVSTGLFTISLAVQESEDKLKRERELRAKAAAAAKKLGKKPEKGKGKATEPLMSSKDDKSQSQSISDNPSL